MPRADLIVKDPAFWFGCTMSAPHAEALRFLCSNPMGVERQQLKTVLGAYLTLRGLWEAESTGSDTVTISVLLKGVRSILSEWSCAEEGLQEREIIQEVHRWYEVFREYTIDAGLDRLRQGLRKIREVRGRLIEEPEDDQPPVRRNYHGAKTGESLTDANATKKGTVSGPGAVLCVPEGTKGEAPKNSSAWTTRFRGSPCFLRQQRGRVICSCLREDVFAWANKDEKELLLMMDTD